MNVYVVIYIITYLIFQIKIIKKLFFNICFNIHNRMQQGTLNFIIIKEHNPEKV